MRPHLLVNDSRVSEHIENVDTLGAFFLEENFCELCRDVGIDRPFEHRHHLFSQTKENKNKYGDLIHHPYNIMKLCSICHESKEIPKMSEIEFCMVLNIKNQSKIERVM